MDPHTLIPSPDALPVAWPWFEVLLIPVFVIHLIFMNALLGSAIIGLTASLRPANQGTGLAQSISRTISQKLPFHMALAINFGVAALLFMQVLYGHLFYTSSILMAVWWLGALGLVLVAYIAIYWLDFRFDGAGALRLGIYTLVVFCLLAVAFVFVNNVTLMADPPSWPRYFSNPGGTLWHWNDPTLIPRYLHFVTASIAVGGLVLALLNRKSAPDKAAHGIRWFTAATAAQLVIGGWFFLALPQSIRFELMGADRWATAVLAVALAGVFSTLYFGTQQKIRSAAWSVGIVILGMVLVRDTVRSAYLQPYFSVKQLTAHGEFSPLVVFVLFVLLGIIAILYMCKLWKGAVPK
jgi:hypothetical protein